MNFLSLYYFSIAAKYENISKAAKELFISQPALTKSIHQLEEEIGYPLFDRAGNKIFLNDNGRILLECANTIQSTIDNSLSRIKDINNNNQKVTISMVAGTKFLSDIIMGIKKEFPQINLSINQENFNPNSYNNLADLYIYSSTTPIDSENAITLLSEDCLLGICRDNPLSRKRTITPKMLGMETFLTMLKNQPLSILANQLFDAGGFTPMDNLQFDNRETIYALISANMGVSLIPSKTWAPYITQPNIVLRPLSSPLKRHIILQWSPNRYMTDNVKAVKNYLLEYFSHF